MSDLHDLMRNAPVVETRRREPTGPRRRRGRIIGIVVAVVILALAGGYIAYTQTAPVGTAVAASTPPAVAVPAPAAIPMSPEGESAVSVSGADEYLGAAADGIWHASGPDAAVPMASISKLITAMVILDAKPLSNADDAGPTIAFDKADHDLYDKYYVLNATIAPMPTGSTMSEHDAIAAMLVVSACNYAEAVSNWAFGSQGAFLSATRKWLAAHGMSHTTMVEPTGLDARNTSTPSDLIALGKLAMANPAVAQIVGQRVLTGPNVQGMASTNDLLGTDGITGIKTGTLAQGSDLLFSATLDVGAPKPLSVIGVVLGGSSHDSVDGHVISLLASIKAGFHSVPLGTAGQTVGTYSTPWGESAQMVLDHDASVLTWSDTPVTAKLTTTTLTTGADGEKV
ncbi:MAG TPA: D-alanyl-D-alanine carboxypeptidase, partial [Pseudolysinimonas sp.]|nr:D-alanyl-D-alanine carboxypeptidase [Pseudolysinimonas sp.]